MLTIKNTINHLTVDVCRSAHVRDIYVFGDNLIQKGRAGQAVIRYEYNSFGVPTKRLPTMNANAFFSDKLDEYKEVFKALERLYNWQEYSDKKIIFPESGLGTGLAKMEEYSPQLFDTMNVYINSKFK